MSTSIEDPRQRNFELVRIALSAGRPLQLQVVGDSMYPLLQAEDSIWVAPVEVDQLQRGDLVVLKQAGGVVTHRVVTRGPAGLRTKGDNRLVFDPPVSEQEILGYVVAIERAGVRMELQNRRWGCFNRLIGVLSWGEAWLFKVGQRVAKRAHARFFRHSRRQLGQIAGLPFSLLRWALSFLIRIA
jgi:hypothetical protein